MKPILKDKNGKVIGWLKDCKTCHVRRRLNGMEELTLTYPISGKYFNELINTHSIEAKSDPFHRPQIFDIYEVGKAINGIVTVKAEHMSYRLSHYPVDKVSLTNVDATAAMIALINSAESKLQNPTHFEVVQTDIPFLAPIDISNVSVKAGFGGVEGSVLDTYGGEFEYDNEKVMLHKHRGLNRGVKFSYGKNITDFELTVSSSSAYTSIYGYYKKDEISLSTIEVVENKSQVKDRAFIRDFSNDFENGVEVTQELLDETVREYLKNNDINSLTVSGKIKVFANRNQSQKIDLGDTVTVSYTDMGIDILAKVIFTDFDALAERYDEIEIGSPRADLATTIKQAQKEQQAIKKEIATSASKLTLERIRDIERITQQITGQKESYIVLNPPTNPAEFLCLDKPDINAAQNVWRFNKAGLAHSSTGYNGIYTLAILADGSINANMIRAGIINANLIRAGIAQSANGEFSFNFESGVIKAAKAHLTGEFTVIGKKADLKVINTAGTARDINGLIGMVRYNKAGKPDAYITFTDEKILDTTKYGIKIESIDSSVLISSRRERQGIRNEINWNGNFTIGVPDGEFARQFMELDNTGMRLDKGIHTNYLLRDQFASITHTRVIDYGNSQYLTWRTVHGAGIVNTSDGDIPTAAVEVHGVTRPSYFARADLYVRGDDRVCILLKAGDLPGTEIYVQSGKLYVGGKEVVTK